MCDGKARELHFFFQRQCLEWNHKEPLHPYGQKHWNLYYETVLCGCVEAVLPGFLKYLLKSWSIVGRGI